MRDPDLANHLRREVQNAQRFMIAFDAELWPIAHGVTAFAFCAAALLEPVR
jgi:hypothetical protein